MGGGIYLLHKVELVRCMVEKCVEGITLCHDMQERTQRGVLERTLLPLVLKTDTLTPRDVLPGASSLFYPSSFCQSRGT